MSNHVHPDEMAHYDPSHQDLNCLQKKKKKKKKKNVLVCRAEGVRLGKKKRKQYKYIYSCFSVLQIFIFSLILQTCFPLTLMFVCLNKSFTAKLTLLRLC